MIEWLKRHLVPEAREFWRLGSVQLAAGASVLTGAIAANPDVLLGLIEFLPERGWPRTAAIMVVIIAVFAVPTVTRLLQQDDEHDDGGDHNG